MSMVLLAALVVPLLAVPVLATLGSRMGPRAGWLALPIPIVSASLIAYLLTGQSAFAERVVTIPWIPSIGINLSFVVDGLSLFFGLVVSGMGVLVTLYAATYLDDHYRDHGRFYSYLMLFMVSMLGCVFSENMLVLFVFWEMTGVSSYLLIGFLHDKEGSREGARMAFITTTAAGLAMLAGVVLLGSVTGTYSIVALRDGAIAAVADTHGGLLTWAFVLMMIGALAKSAQFPFHYWLPNAMAAPTPVSAYLHSATMVKLGVFFVARTFPLLGFLDAWAPVLVTIGFFTMLLGAVFAVLSHDLKALLAYSTVSQLGFLVGYYGMGVPPGMNYDLMHIANHVFYKGCLFMVVGIVDHAAGTRDLRKLGGLIKLMPLLGVIAIIAAAAMAGIPLTMGFISKEYMLKSQFAYLDAASWFTYYPLIMVTAASVMKMVFSLRLIRGTFFGPLPHKIEHHFHKPNPIMLVPPLLLATGALVFGLLPGLMGPALEMLSVQGLHLEKHLHISLWHGVTKEFLLSMGIIAVGVAICMLIGVRGWQWVRIPKPLQFDVGFNALINSVPTIAKKITFATGAERPLLYLPIILTVLFGAVGAALIANLDRLPGLSGELDIRSLFDPLRTFVVALVLIATIGVVALRRWTTQLIALGTVGFLLTFYFVLFRAPDLAMTQILVEAAQLILVLLLLSRFPRAAEIGERTSVQRGSRRAVNAFVAILAGLVVTTFTFVVASQKHEHPAGDWYIERTVPDAKGSNAVNTILVDFRGFDTLMEVTVLVIATLGALGLLMRVRRTRVQYEAGPMGPAGLGVIHETDAERERWTDR